MPQFSVIIVNFNAGDWLRRCVDALAAQDGDFEAVIIDNASTDGSVDALPELDTRFRILRQDSNLGFAAANNLGAEVTTGEWVVCLNPDAFPRPGWLSAFDTAIKKYPDATMFGSTQIFANDPDHFDGLGDEYHISGLAWRAGFGHAVRSVSDRRAFGPCAAGAAYRRDAFEAAGGFDDRFFCYHEDVDLAFRMRRLGGECVQLSDAVIDHVSSGIAGRASDFAVYHGTRNRIWTFRSNMPKAAWPVHFVASFAMLGWSLFRPGRFSPTWRGTKDGWLSAFAPRPLPDTSARSTALSAMTKNPLPLLRRGVPSS